jgi:hypothetical protein
VLKYKGQVAPPFNNLLVEAKLLLEPPPEAIRDRSWKCGVEQYVRLQIVDKQVGIAVEPFGILLSELGEDCLALTFDLGRRLVDQRFDLYCFLGRWWRFCRIPQIDHHHRDKPGANQQLPEHRILIRTCLDLWQA